MKPLIVVPVFNAEPVIHGVIDDLLVAVDWPLLVVDDGSEPKLQIRHHKRIEVLRLDENKGKGAALQKAMQWGWENKYTHILTIDGDGQHRANDAPLLLQKSASAEKSIIIGARVFDETVPWISRFGRRFSNFWVRYQTGVAVSDSQSGLRIYPLIELHDLKYFTQRYDFEIEVLVRGIWRGLSVEEVDVGVIYAPKEERISHFHKFWDNARITLLNIVLIAYSLVFYQRSLIKVVLAGIIAFVCGTMTSLTWAILLGLLVCVIFRFNIVLFAVALLGLKLI